MTRARATRISPGRLKLELDRLGGMGATELSAHWRRAFGRAAPPGLSPALLRRALACRLQEQVLGALDRETARALDRMAGEGGPVIPLPELLGRKPGTLLVREWQGAMHSVMALETGYAWSGRTYRNLSEVAQAITGTKWNGPRFFGLRAKAGSKTDAKAPA